MPTGAGKAKTLEARCDKEVREQHGWRKREYLLSRTLQGHLVFFSGTPKSSQVRSFFSSMDGLISGFIQGKQGKETGLPASAAFSEMKVPPSAGFSKLLGLWWETHTQWLLKACETQSWESSCSCGARQIWTNEEP